MFTKTSINPHDCILSWRLFNKKTPQEAKQKPIIRVRFFDIHIYQHQTSFSKSNRYQIELLVRNVTLDVSKK